MDILGNVDFSPINNLFAALLTFTITLVILIAFATLVGKKLRLSGTLLNYFVVVSILLAAYFLIAKIELFDRFFWIV